MWRRIWQLFLVYSFLGWLLEGGFQWWQTGKFQKPNFLHGPIKPMYGFGGLLLLASYRYDRKHFGGNCCLIPLLVELGSGMWLEREFHLKYWDYSKEIVQLGGYICLKFALCWMLLAQILVRFVQPVVNLLLKLTGWIPIWQALYQFFMLDCLFTIPARRRTCRQLSGK